MTYTNWLLTLKIQQWLATSYFTMATTVTATITKQ